MEINKREELMLLFDLYGSLLTDKQRQYFEEYYFLDYSLSEIAGNHDVSRNAIFDQLKKLEANLESYESKLKLLNKNTRILNIVEKNNDDKNLIEIKKIIEE